MDSDSDESTRFAFLIGEHKDVLIKSRTVEQTKKKEAVAAQIIQKWTEFTGKTFTQAGLYKKINNLKSRAKLALSGGKHLNDWQSNLLEIEGANFATDEDEEIPDLPKTSTDKDSDGITAPESDASQLLEEHETSETKLLNNEQLQRFVLLKQVKVLTLQQQRLEKFEEPVHSEKEKDIVFEFIG